MFSVSVYWSRICSVRCIHNFELCDFDLVTLDEGKTDTSCQALTYAVVPSA